MIDFNDSSVFKLERISNDEISRNAYALMVEDEEVLHGYKTFRDQVIFTNKRIITVNIKGITGKRQELMTMPYKKIQYFSVQTVGFLELIPDSELILFFANGQSAKFSFETTKDILEIGQVISEFIL